MSTGVYVAYKYSDDALEFVNQKCLSEEDRESAENIARYFEAKFESFGVDITGKGFIPLGLLCSRFPGSATVKFSLAIALSAFSWFIVATILGLCWAVISYEVFHVYTDYNEKKEA